jgi:hypothetical protein
MTLENSVAINMGVHVSLQYVELHFFGHMARSNVAGSFGSSIFIFL